MSSIIDDLNTIYTTKLQIKNVIGTQSDVFSEYPGLIEDAIYHGTAADRVTWEQVAAYGYVVPAGIVELSTNGTFDVSTYATAYVDTSNDPEALTYTFLILGTNP